MSELDHILLFSYLFIVFIEKSKYSQDYVNSNFWKWAMLPIISYILIIGMRYGWGADYDWYKFRFEHPDYYGNESPGFYILNTMMKEFGFNFVMAYITYSTLYIFGACVLIKDFENNKYMLTFFLPATIIFSTSIIRQSVAISFAYIMIYAILNKKWLLLLIFAGITYTIHPVVLAMIVPILIFHNIFNGYLISLKFSVPLYIICSISTNLFKDYISTPLSQMIGTMTFGDIGFMNEYAKRSDEWFGSEAINADWYQSPLTLLLSMMFDLFVIIVCHIALKNNMNTKVASIYNTVVIGYISYRLFFPVEIMHRFTDPLYMLYFIPLGYAFYQYKFDNLRWTSKELKVTNILFCGGMLYLIPYFLRFIFLFPESSFVWHNLL